MENKKPGIPLLEAGKWILVVLLVIYIASTLATGKVSSTSFDVMSDIVTNAADLSEMSLGNDQMIRRLYGLDPDSYEGILLYYPTSNMGSTEILLVKLKDTSQSDTVVNAINTRVTTQMNAFAGYGQDQYEMLGNSVVTAKGNYVLFVSADDTAPVVQAFLGGL